MNRATIRRWINEYLDGEIGLADKAELEEVMANHPDVRREYTQLRRLGLYLGSMLEVSVHPVRFRQRVLEALDAQQRTYFTPQRAFAGAMLVAFLVIGLTFGLLLYQQRMLGDGVLLPPQVTRESVIGHQQADGLALNVAAAPEEFLNRILVEHRLGLIDDATLNPFLTQTHVLEGAVCRNGGGLNIVRFPAPLPNSIRISVTPAQAKALSAVAEELTGHSAELTVQGRDGTSPSLAEFLQLQQSDRPVYLTINFR